MDQIAEEEARTVVTHNRKRNEPSSQTGESEAAIDDDDYDIMVSYLVRLLIYSLKFELTNII